MRLLSLTACLAVSSAAFAIDPNPGSYASAGPVSNGASNADFLAASASLGSQYFNGSTATAGTFFTVPTGLTIGEGYGLRVWFVSQSAGYRNAFGVVTDADGSEGSPQSQIAFANSHALSNGDYVDINGGGEVEGAVSFFALANVNGAGTSSQYQWFDGNGTNADGVSHINMTMNQFVGGAGSLWYALALDDQCGGGDRDWNDLRLLLEVRPVAAPEPGTIALFMGFLAVAAWMWRRQQLVAA